MWETASAVAIDEPARQILQGWLRAHSTPQSIATRARIVLRSAEGASVSQTAREIGVSRPTVLLWRERFAAGGPTALTVIEPGRGRKPSIAATTVKRIVDTTLRGTPKGATHWSCRRMADEVGVSADTVHRIWRANGLQPHRIKTFKLSTDPHFVEKLTDVIGLYLDPPDRAVVLCLDEKSQIQALDRTQPGLPLKRGRCGTMTHDYKRHGTTSLFAALNVLEGTVIAQCLTRHRHQEFLRFLQRLDREFPRRLALHAIVDNYGTHKHPAVTAWLAAHPRFVLHFTPTGSSWTNLIERVFCELTVKQLRRGAFASVSDLTKAIYAFIDEFNRDPKPFTWTASVESILAKLRRCKALYRTLH